MRSERWQESHCLSWYKHRLWPSFADKSIFVGAQELAGTRQQPLEHKDWRLDGSPRVRGGAALCPRGALLSAETDPSARISPVGRWERVSKGGSSPSSALLSPLVQDTGVTCVAGGGERPGAQSSGLEFFKEHGSCWPRGDPTREPRPFQTPCL